MKTVLLIIKGQATAAEQAAAERGIAIEIASALSRDTRAYADACQLDAIVRWFAEPNPETGMIHGEGSGFPVGTLLFYKEVRTPSGVNDFDDLPS